MKVAACSTTESRESVTGIRLWPGTYCQSKYLFEQPGARL